jgi:CelD/BcsL family acetyltransferase involved in cellulose biosynthesis
MTEVLPLAAPVGIAAGGPSRHASRTATIDPIEDPRWRELLSRHRSSLFHAPAWIRALRDTYGFEVRADLLIDATGRPASGIVYSPVQDVMDPRIVSLPFSDYCDPILEGPEAWPLLAGPLLDQGRRIQLRWLHTTAALADDHFAVTGRARWHQVDVESDPDRMWQSLDGSARRAVRKARQQGVTVSVAQDERDLRSFFELHLRVRKRKYGLLAQPYRFFGALWEGFLQADDGMLLLARHRGTVIGGVLFLGWGDTLYYKFNASDPQHLDARPNDLIVWESLLYAAEHGYRFLDFGLSAWDQEGLVRFKRKYATDERVIHLLRHSPTEGPSRGDIELRALFDRLTGVFVGDQVPDHITEEAGDALYRYFV